MHLSTLILLTKRVDLDATRMSGQRHEMRERLVGVKMLGCPKKIVSDLAGRTTVELVR